MIFFQSESWGKLSWEILILIGIETIPGLWTLLRCWRCAWHPLSGVSMPEEATHLTKIKLSLKIKQAYINNQGTWYKGLFTEVGHDTPYFTDNSTNFYVHYHLNYWCYRLPKQKYIQTTTFVGWVKNFGFWPRWVISHCSWLQLKESRHGCENISNKLKEWWIRICNVGFPFIGRESKVLQGQFRSVQTQLFQEPSRFFVTGSFCQSIEANPQRGQ